MAHEVQFTWQARAAVESLSPPERNQVLASIERLREGPNPPGVSQVHRLRGTEGIYVLRTGRDSRLWVVFTLGPDHTISIRDVFSQDLVEEYRRSVAS